MVCDLLPGSDPNRTRGFRRDVIHELNGSVFNICQTHSGFTLVKAGKRPGLPITLQ